MDHPQVVWINRTGYPQDMQEKHCGTDWRGSEVLAGDEVIHDPQLDEIILKEDLVDYLKEKYGFVETVAE